MAMIKNKGKTIGTITGALALVAVTISVTLIILNLTRKEEPPKEAREIIGGRGVVATPENIDDLRESEPVSDGYYQTRMNTEWIFQTPKSPSDNARVENSTKNTRTVYFDLIIPDTNELIYSSPFIPVGGVLEKFALDAELPAGEHTATVVYHLVDDDYQDISTVSVSVKLQILG